MASVGSETRETLRSVVVSAASEFGLPPWLSFSRCCKRSQTEISHTQGHRDTFTVVSLFLAYNILIAILNSEFLITFHVNYHAIMVHAPYNSNTMA